MKSLLLLAAVIVCFSAYAASEPNTGAWTAELDGDELLGTISSGTASGTGSG